MPLPESFRWADAPDGSANLYLRYGSIASIKPDGEMKLKYWQKEFNAKAASVAQAKRFVERWILAQNSPRAYECARWRARFSKSARPPIPKRKEHFDVSLYAKSPGRRPEGGNLCSRVARRMPEPDEF